MQQQGGGGASEKHARLQATRQQHLKAGSESGSSEAGTARPQHGIPRAFHRHARSNQQDQLGLVWSCKTAAPATCGGARFASTPAPAPAPAALRWVPHSVRAAAMFCCTTSKLGAAARACSYAPMAFSSSPCKVGRSASSTASQAGRAAAFQLSCAAAWAAGSGSAACCNASASWPVPHLRIELPTQTCGNRKKLGHHVVEKKKITVRKVLTCCLSSTPMLHQASAYRGMSLTCTQKISS